MSDRTTSRGFRILGDRPIETSTGQPSRIEVRESSAAWSSSRANPDGDRGPFLWLDVEDEYPRPDPDRLGKFLPLTEPNSATAHLNYREALELYHRLGRWLVANRSADDHGQEAERG